MKTDRKMIQQVLPTDEPFIKICVGDEEVLTMSKESSWKIERVFLDFWQPCEELVIIFKKKEEKDEK